MNILNEEFHFTSDELHLDSISVLVFCLIILIVSH